MVKRITPLEGMTKTIDNIINFGFKNPLRTEFGMFRITEGNWLVDTCVAHDTEMWETAVQREGEYMVIVQQYESREKAKIGHNKWVKKMRLNPKRKLKDINVWSVENG